MDIVWKLFEKTGKIEYYLIYKEMQKTKDEEYARSRGNNSKRN